MKIDLKPPSKMPLFINKYAAYLITGVLIVAALLVMIRLQVNENNTPEAASVEEAEDIIIGAAGIAREQSTQAAIDHIEEELTCDCIIENQQLLHQELAKYYKAIDDLESATNSYSNALASYEEYPDPNLVYEYAVLAFESENFILAQQQFTFLKSLLGSEFITSYKMTDAELEKLNAMADEYLLRIDDNA